MGSETCLTGLQMACKVLTVQADEHTAAGAADDVLTLPADVGMSCSRIKRK